MKLYVGTYTRPAPYLAATDGEGLYVLDYDEAGGQLALRQQVPGIENASYLCVSPDGRSLHAISEVLDWPEGIVSSFAIDPSSGELGYRSLQGSRGALACYVTMDSGSRSAFVTNYVSGSVAMLPATEEGSLAQASDVQQLHGSGPDPARQEGPHAHCVVVTADDAFAFVTDLGADHIVGFRIDHAGGLLERHSELTLPAGAGPRHFLFAPSGRHAYAICELDSTMAALAYEPASGRLSLIDTYPMLPDDFSGESHCADLAIHPSGRFVYGSNRGHDSITGFRVEPSTGRLERIGQRSSEGATPRNMAMAPDGRFLLVANQDSGTIVSLPIDADSGALGETSSVAQVPTPVCMKFGSRTGAGG